MQNRCQRQWPVTSYPVQVSKCVGF